ncbi:MAG: peptidoglycan glycosyltransferase FtsI, partial [Pseudomonadota bacterium]
MSTRNSEQKIRRQKGQKNNGAYAKTKASPMLVHWRFALVLVLVVAVFLSIAGRAAYLQVIEPGMLIERGDNRTVRVRDNVNYRGLITDRNGQQLAVSIPAKAIFADPKEIHKKNAFEDHPRWQALARVLETDVDKLKSRVSDPNRRFVYLKLQLTPAMSDFVKNLKLPGVYLRDESKRYYPMGEVSAHIVGFTDVDDIGQEGIEKLYNTHLTGTPDKRRIRRNAQGKQIEIIEQEAGKIAEDLQLTIDQRIQALAYREIKAATIRYQATSASVVIVD